MVYGIHLLCSSLFSENFTKSNMKRALICFIIFLSVPFSAISQNPSQQTIIIVNTSGGYGDDGRNTHEICFVKYKPDEQVLEVLTFGLSDATICLIDPNSCIVDTFHTNQSFVNQFKFHISALGEYTISVTSPSFIGIGYYTV